MDNKNRNFLIYRYQVIPDMRSFIPDYAKWNQNS